MVLIFAKIIENLKKIKINILDYISKNVHETIKQIKMDKSFQEHLDDFEQSYNFRYSQSIM